MKKQNNSFLSKLKSAFAILTIVVLITVAHLIYYFVLGNPANFEGGNPDNHPLPGNYLGIVYKGGVIVPFLMSFFMMVFTFSLERFFTITLASGRGSISEFVRKIKSHLDTNNITAAIAECDKQKGSVGNVIRAVLEKYKELADDTSFDKEQKVAALQKELEDATSLELPMLEKNLVVIATLASVSTLVGLLGTVIGMIRAFAALAQAGSPDSVALANGISEALINTALGIASSALAIITYNYFTSKIDALSYSIDEAGFSIIQSFNANVKA
ncbi:MAG: MotA/TolQ/ExbB proton channel family protein [Microscillaceae bacterium]|nr:MotA/TolQ/ExbB proton channel family protein [Microscillaceae bacterium]MDW8460440.1 MotA/TolQ/ExbB proton channel family protein [Cytophagales bacterium]